MTKRDNSGSSNSTSSNRKSSNRINKNKKNHSSSLHCTDDVDTTENENNVDDDDDDDDARHVHSTRFQPPPTQVLPISDVVYNLVLPSQQQQQHQQPSVVGVQSTTPPSHSRYQFRHSIQIQQNDDTTTDTSASASSSSSSNVASTMLLQTISTGDLIFIDCDGNGNDSNDGNVNNNNNDGNVNTNDIDIIKHYQKMIVPPPNYNTNNNKKKKKKLNWRVGYVMGFVTSYNNNNNNNNHSVSATKSTTETTDVAAVVVSQQQHHQHQQQQQLGGLHEDHRVIVTWLIPYTYIQEHDQKRQQQQQQSRRPNKSSSSTHDHHYNHNDDDDDDDDYEYLDRTAYQNIHQQARPDGMLFRLPPSSSSLSSTTTTNNNNTTTSNILQLFQLFGPTTIPTSHIVLNTVVTMIPFTNYDPKKSKVPRDLLSPHHHHHHHNNNNSKTSITHPLPPPSIPVTIVTQPSSVSPTTMTTTTTDTSSLELQEQLPSVFHCYEYYFHCHNALPIVQQDVSSKAPHSISTIITTKEPIRCVPSDFVPQPPPPLSLSSNIATNHHHHHHNTTTTMIVPPKMVQDAWHLLRTSLSQLPSSSPPSTIGTNNNWFQQLFSASSSLSSSVLKSTSTTTVTQLHHQQQILLKSLDALIEAMIQPYPSQHYIAQPHNKFQFIITRTAVAPESSMVVRRTRSIKDPRSTKQEQQHQQQHKHRSASIKTNNDMPTVTAKRKKTHSSMTAAVPAVEDETDDDDDDDDDDDEHVDNRMNKKMKHCHQEIVTTGSARTSRNTSNNSIQRMTATKTNVLDKLYYQPNSNHRLEAPLYSHRTTTTNRTKKTKTKSPSSCTSLHFYSQIDLIKTNDRKKSSTWTIHVGDVIAVAEMDPTIVLKVPSPIYTDYKNKHTTIKKLSSSKTQLQEQSPWYPFHRPWTPGQIVALYEEHIDDSTSTDSTTRKRAHSDETVVKKIKMQIRWFYRPHDIPDDVVEESAGPVRRDLFDDHSDKTTQGFKKPSSQEAMKQQQQISGRQFIEVDEDVEEMTVQAALGRIIVTSQKTPSWNEMNTYRNTNDGVDQLPIICRYAYSLVDYSGAESLVPLRDDQSWTNYSSSTAPTLSSSVKSPFYRGLTCPKSFPGRIPSLFKAYVDNRDWTLSIASDVCDGALSNIPQRHSNNNLVSTDENCVFYMDDDDDHGTNVWPEELLSSSSSSETFDVRTADRKNERVVTICQDVDSGLYREFLLSIPTKVLTKRCDPRATAKKSTSECQQWTLQIGDVVAVAYNGARKHFGMDIRSISDGKKRWFPFLGPWRVCQVLNIYRDVVADKAGNFLPSGPTLLEVRWFLHKSDLPSRVWEWMPPYHSKFEQDEVYESNTVDKGLPVDHVLGCVALYLGEQSLVSNRKGSNVQSDIPEAICRCRYYYNESLERFQPLFCSEAAPRRWFQRIVERGFKLSPMTQNFDNLRQGIELGLDLRLSNEGVLFRNMISSDHALTSSREKMFLNPLAERNKMNCEYFLSTSISPSWTKMSQPDFICAASDRKGACWIVRVGDIVAIEVPEISSVNQSGDRCCFPFKVNWKVAQVLAIYRNGGSINAGTTADLEIQVRWLYRRYDNVFLDDGTANETIDIVYSSNDVSGTSHRKMDLLGPVTLFPGSEKDRCEISLANVWKTTVPFLPVVPLTYAGHFDHIEQKKVTSPSMRNVARAGIELSTHYDDEARNCLLQALHQEVLAMEQIGAEQTLPVQIYLNENANPNILIDTYDDSSSAKENSSVPLSKCKRGSGRTKAWTALPPFYTNRSAGIEYFSEIDVEPPFDSYATDCITNDKAKKRIWTIKLGDPVIVHHEICAGRAEYHASVDERIKVFSSMSTYFPFTVPWAVAEIVHIMRIGDKESKHLKLEIRWFYRKNEISSKAIKDRSVKDLESEEVCESDHYDEIEPTNILAPAHMYDSPRQITIGNRFNGMPLVEFHCHRFWSVHRRSLKPIGEFNGRIERGRMQSKSIVRDHSLRAALLGLTKISDPEPVSSSGTIVSYNDAFQSVIHKLSLTDASREAHNNSSALIGREKERKEIYAFLRSSISGTGQGSTSSRASLFIAGPPGTGKTACVLSVISDFQREKSIGGVIDFDFIPLNGMEMRDPFEAYVKLWSHLEGESSRCNAETSASRLEAYFTGKFEPNDRKKSRVSVVLLDEIDYLVTKKQSVLYNFFDWPTRSMESQSNRRLVVIGVSNTLNLPERLHPRVQSRIGSKRIFFKSYSVDETVTILNSKLQQASPTYSVFDADAILYASKKTAALSGDIRKAFHICRSAAEMILYEAESSNESIENPIVRIKDVLKVSRESTNAAQPRSVGLCAPFQVLFLVALAALSKTTGREYGGFDVEEITTKMRSIADAFGDPKYLPPPSLPETLNMISRLRDIHLVAMTTPRDTNLSFRASLAGSGGPWPLVSMVMDDLAIVVALKETPHYDLAQKFLSRSSF